MRRRAAGLGALAVLLSVAASAPAGTYVVSSCGTAGLATNAAWTALPTGDAPVTTEATCAAGPLRAADALGTGRNAPTGTTAGFTFAAPAGATITGLAYRRRLRTYLDIDWHAETLTADGGVLEACRITETGPLTCDRGGAGGADATFPGLSTSALTVRIRCTATAPEIACGTGSSIHRAEAEIHSAQVTLSESSPPAITTAPAGALLDGAWLRGTSSVAASASDGLGIERFDVLLSDVPAGTSPRAFPACDYRRPRPCVPADAQATPGAHTSQSGPIAVDTTAVADGVHEAVLVAVDAAGNATRSDTWTVRVDNTAPQVLDVVPTDAGWSSAATRTVAVPATPDAQHAPLVAAHVRLCPVGTTDGCGDVARIVGDVTALPVTVPSDGTWQVRLRLEDAAGNVGAEGVAEDGVLRRDTVAPTAAVVAPSTATAGVGIPVSLAADDTTSGVDPARTSLVALPASGAPVGFRSGEALPAGDWMLLATVTDRAGNAATASTTVRVTPAPETPAVPAAPSVPAPPAAAAPTPSAASRLAAVRLTAPTARWTRAADDRRLLTVRATLRGVPAGTRIGATFRGSRMTVRRRGALVTATLRRRAPVADRARLILRLDGARRTFTVRVPRR